MYPLKIKEKYDRSNLAKLAYRFSVAYLWNYKPSDTDEETWSHPWVDIVPEKKNQETFSVLDGKVFKAWEDWAYWKYVFIEHPNVPHPDDLTKTTTVFSCYQHLSEVVVKTWDILKEWDLIGKTWNTWNSFWEHLHFQIDRVEAPFHSYWPFTWAEAKAAWVGFSDWVNLWLWKDKAKMYTINPLVYLDKVEEYRNNSPKVVTNEVKEEVKVTSTLEVVNKVETPTLNNVITSDTPVVTPISTTPETIISNNTPKVESINTSTWNDNILSWINLDDALGLDKKKL